MASTALQLVEAKGLPTAGHQVSGGVVLICAIACFSFNLFRRPFFDVGSVVSGACSSSQRKVLCFLRSSRICFIMAFTGGPIKHWGLFCLFLCLFFVSTYLQLGQHFHALW